MNIKNTRIDNLRTYLCKVIDTLTTNKNFKINANMLSKNVNNYSLDKIPTASTVEKWVNGVEIHKDVYSFRSRKEYSTNEINNLQNIGFFEIFESTIKSNNKKGVLPNIKGIESIECLNCGTMLSADTNTAIFDIQIQITYREE
jgi:hypothetical protein